MQDDFEAMNRDAGFHIPGKDGEDTWENLRGGIVAVHRGIKI